MELLCPDVGVFRCLSFVAERLYSVVVRDVARVVSARYINKGRSPQNCIERGCVSVRPSDAILRDDELICFAYANKIGAMRPLRWPRTTLGSDVAMVLALLMVLNGLKNCRLTFLIPHWNLRLSPFWGRVALLLAGLGERLGEFMGDSSEWASERGRGRISREHRRKREGGGVGVKKSPRAVRVYAPEGSYFLG